MVKLSERDKLNAEVTDAVLEAERLLDEATRAWERLATAEAAAFEGSPEGVERDIALAGTQAAQLTVRVLQSLGGRLASKTKRTTVRSVVRQVAIKDKCLECGAVTYHPDLRSERNHYPGCSQGEFERDGSRRGKEGE